MAEALSRLAPAPTLEQLAICIAPCRALVDSCSRPRFDIGFGLSDAALTLRYTRFLLGRWHPCSGSLRCRGLTFGPLVGRAGRGYHPLLTAYCAPSFPSFRAFGWRLGNVRYFFFGVVVDLRLCSVVVVFGFRFTYPSVTNRPDLESRLFSTTPGLFPLLLCAIGMSSDNVVHIADRAWRSDEPSSSDCWQCECGSAVFLLRRSGHVECAQCSAVADPVRCVFWAD